MNKRLNILWLYNHGGPIVDIVVPPNSPTIYETSFFIRFNFIMQVNKNTPTNRVPLKCKAKLITKSLVTKRNQSKPNETKSKIGKKTKPTKENEINKTEFNKAKNQSWLHKSENKVIEIKFKPWLSRFQVFAKI